MSLPAIGVVIPCYKAEHTLRQTVESVLQGAPDNLQLVLVEDGSPDGTGALCDALAAQDPRVTALHQPNGGASAARNAGLDTLCRSGAEWVLFVDADDTLLPGLWQALPAAFDAHPGLILYGMVRASGPAPNPLAPGSLPFSTGTSSITSFALTRVVYFSESKAQSNRDAASINEHFST